MVAFTGITNVVLLLANIFVASGQQDLNHKVTLQSPDARIRLTLDPSIIPIGLPPLWEASFAGREIVSGRLGLWLKDEGIFLIRAPIVGERHRLHDGRIPGLFGKARLARDRYNEVRLQFRSGRGRRFG